jgi:ribosomal protein S21
MIKKSKKQKIYESDLGGCKVRVVEKDIELALRILRQKFKSSEKLELYKEKREFVKPSIKRRKEILTAIHNEKIKQNREN